MSLSGSSTTSTVWPLASLVGALCGGGVWPTGRPAASQGRADPGAEPRPDPGGPVRLPGRLVRSRSRCSSPRSPARGCARASTTPTSSPRSSTSSAPEDRGTAAGLMNTVGWTGGFLAPVGGRHWRRSTSGLSVAIASTAAVYLLVGSWPGSRLAWPRPERHSVSE